MEPTSSRSNSRSVLTKEEAEKVAVSYSPQKFPSFVTATAKDFVAFQSRQSESGTDSAFRIDRIVAEQTGVADLERASIEEKVERQAIERLKELQEQAYQQAYQLGLDEGREKAFVEASASLLQKIDDPDTVIASIERLKTDLITFNETHIVKLVFYMAKRVVMDEITEKPELVLGVIRQAVESAQSEESVTVKVSQNDYDFIESTREKLGKEFECIKSATLEASESISDGGCVISTNYGDVDATVEQRLETLWKALANKLPKVKSTVGTEGSHDPSGNE